MLAEVLRFLENLTSLSKVAERAAVRRAWDLRRTGGKGWRGEGVARPKG